MTAKIFDKFCILLLVVCLTTLTSGCSSNVGKTISVLSPDFFGIGEELAQQLITNRRRSFGLEERLIFTSMVNLDNLRQTSKLGRTLSESLATQLFQHGYGVVELRKVASILIKNKSGGKNHICPLSFAQARPRYS